MDQGCSGTGTGDSDRNGGHGSAVYDVLHWKRSTSGLSVHACIKICGSPHTYERMQHDMDLNAGRIIQGEKTIEEVGEEAFRLMLDVLSGKMTKNEALGYYGSMDIFCLGPVI